MADLVGVHFRNAGKVSYIDPGELQLHMNDKVICETPRGMEMGTVRVSNLDFEFKTKYQKENDHKIIRLATAEDIEKERDNRKAEDEAYKICKKKIDEHELEMKLVEAQYTFDKKKLTFYFLADGRVDFRALVKDLASSFHTRIELRQIGVRDETKIVGGIGMCGRELCCATFLGSFSPVSIKMAKEQNLSLNPTKISGVCGRLMCCLKNEEEAYEELNKILPRRGDAVTTPDGKEGEVQSVDVLREKVRVFTENGDSREVKEYHVSELKFDPAVHKKARKNKASNNEAVIELTEEIGEEVIEELSSLEDNDEIVVRNDSKSKGQDRNRQRNNNNNGGKKNGKAHRDSKDNRNNKGHKPNKNRSQNKDFKQRNKKNRNFDENKK